MNISKTGLGTALLPVARVLVQHTPSKLIKEWLWLHWGWRPKSFLIKSNNVLISGDTTDLIQKYVYWFGVWEPNLTQFIRRRMNENPDRTFIDVGANIGYFSTLVAKNYPKAKVVAVEAFPPIVDKLRASVSRNDLKNVRIVAEAASDAVGSLEFFYAGPTNEGATTSTPGRFKTVGVLVSCRPLGELVTPQELIDARLIKIDVEGAEFRVVKGLQPQLALLALDAEVIVEISPDSAEKTTEIFEAFAANGFFPYELENSYESSAYLHRSEVSPPKRIESMPTRQTDIVFSRIDASKL